ncbi:cytochrome c family protein [Roseibacterium elongatum DSM 19469]|uniref:Cytochrome c family protein n=1 Tax=Roseicyclus elongatus DSM 19469 TaxID=1294273 RepID=W8S574_9RHOB|nr:cytochrome c [Roseibacterium elongatum]AHM05377.1 cytochrome c family protein [Roseibacterium elongatum DSM 19469]
MKPLMMAAALALAAGGATAQDAGEGALLYQAYCAACHGESGQGDGRMAELLTIQPTVLTELSLRNGGSFPTLRVVRQIDGRDPILAHGGDMPIFGRWFEGQGPDVALATAAGQPVMVARPIADLVAYLLEIQE